MEKIPTNAHDEWPTHPVLAYLRWRGVYHLTRQSRVIFGIASRLFGIVLFMHKPRKADFTLPYLWTGVRLISQGQSLFLSVMALMGSICDILISNAWEGHIYRKTDFCDLTLTAKIQSRQAVFKLGGYVCLHKKQNEANIGIYIWCKILTLTTEKECFSSYLGNHTERINNQDL